MKLIGHCHGLLVTSPSFGFNPAFPCSMTACDSKNRAKKPGAYTWKLTFGTAIMKKKNKWEKLSFIIYATSWSLLPSLAMHFYLSKIEKEWGWKGGKLKINGFPLFLHSLLAFSSSSLLASLWNSCILLKIFKEIKKWDECEKKMLELTWMEFLKMQKRFMSYQKFD